MAAAYTEALNDDSRLVALAATIPDSSLRAALLHTLQRHWEEGPEGLDSFVAPDGPAIEPGFLMLLKTLRRKEARGRDATYAPSRAKSAAKTADLRPPGNAKSKPRKNGRTSPEASYARSVSGFSR